MRTLLVATMAAALVLLLPGLAQAYYVDISITGAGRVYETTDANELDEHCPDTIEGFASPGTTPTSTLGATCRAGSADGDYGLGWVVRYVAEPAAGYRFDGWRSDGRSNPGPVLCDGSNGSPTYSGTACQFATFEDLQVRAHFVDDTPPALHTLTGPNQDVNGPATFTFSAASDPTFRLFQCRVGGVHEWQQCSSGRSEDPPTGNYTFQVRAVDWSGNVSSIQAWEWTVDKVAPETSLTSGPSGTVASTSAQFEFNSNESGSFTCSLDAVQVSCGSPKAYSGLAQGSHTFTVAARDVAGNVDASPATRTWTVDTTPPDTTIDSGPGQGSSTQSTSATFTFSSNEAGTFECAVDGGAFAACTSPYSLSGLAVGSHTFSVRAVDAVGNADPSAATRTWVVTAPPNTGGGGTTGGDSTGGDSTGGDSTGGGGTTSTPAGSALTPFSPRVVRRYALIGARTRLTTLTIKKLPREAKVQVRCIGGKRKGCTFKKKSVKHRGGNVKLAKVLRRLKLKKGAAIELRITAVSGQRKVVRYVIRRGKAPKVRQRCAAPGGKLGRCS